MASRHSISPLSSEAAAEVFAEEGEGSDGVEVPLADVPGGWPVGAGAPQGSCG